MTDDLQLRDRFLGWYGTDVVFTDCQRTGNTSGIHYHPQVNRRRAGEEVLVDVCLAARARAFVGNGCSNPTLAVTYMKSWQQEDLSVFGPRIDEISNLALHHW